MVSLPLYLPGPNDKNGISGSDAWESESSPAWKESLVSSGPAAVAICTNSDRSRHASTV